jgi:hypothetical protein
MTGEARALGGSHAVPDLVSQPPRREPFGSGDERFTRINRDHGPGGARDLPR